MTNAERKIPDFGRSFTFMFEDKDWLPKILVGAAFVLLSLPVVGLPFLLGYLVTVVQGAYNDREVPLPEWDDFGALFSKGVAAFVIIAVLTIPGLLLFILTPGLLPTFCYMLLATFIAPILVARYAITGDLNSAFDLAEIVLLVKENVANLAAGLTISVLLLFIGGIGILALILGCMFTAFYALLGLSYLFGKVYREAMKESEDHSEASQASVRS